MAPRKRVDPLQAKAAKQKKIAIGGVVVLCLLLAVQGPKTLKMMKGPAPTTAAAPAPAAPAAPVPGAPAPVDGTAAPADGTAAPTGPTDLSALADSDLPPAPDAGQLVSFERFASKDPFVPQAVSTPKPEPAAPADGGDAGSDGGSGSGGGSDPVDGGFTPAPADGSGGGSSSPNPAAPAAATLTSISVNGTAEDVEVKKPFPAAQPTFVLVSLAKNGKSVQIGIAGGTYADGGQTIALQLGKPLTLQNTADGTRYELELLAVAGFVPPTR